MSESPTVESGRPTPPIAVHGGIAQARSHIGAETPLLDDFVGALTATGVESLTTADATGEASRDWWPLAMIWATQGELPARAGIVVRPTDANEVAAVHRVCHQFGVPLVPVAGRSGVLGSSVPLFGGVALDTTAMVGITNVDTKSGLVDVSCGTFGDLFEEELRRDHGLTVGHWPQSMALSTVGGWVACRGAGQLSTRYGTIADLVAGVEVVLADGEIVHLGGFPKMATGGDLLQLFVGSEGTLGTITSVTLRARPVPSADASAAYAFDDFSHALDAMRRTVRRGATPAVLRLYDAIESDRSYSTGNTRNLLLAYDETDPALLEATMAILAEECADAETMDAALVEQWFGHRNDVAALERLISDGFVVDTMEVSGRWADLDAIYEATLAALRAIPDTIVASAHQSHSYIDGGCIYFTFGGKPAEADRESFYRAAWEAGTTAALQAGASLSHHHSVGLNRARFAAAAGLDAGDIRARIKAALDPSDICNPGKMGLPTHRAPRSPWP